MDVFTVIQFLDYIPSIYRIIGTTYTTWESLNILNFLAKVNMASWAQIKATLEAREQRSLPNSTIAGTLDTLVKTGLITKSNGQYHVTDPLLITGIQQEPLPEG